MGKIKVKRKSTLIDMTAMSDVTVLLLTFFMLTSTFLQKEPTQVITPPSVSENLVPESNMVQVLVATHNVETQDKATGKIVPLLDEKGDQVTNLNTFITIYGVADEAYPEKDEALGLEPGMWSSANMRKLALRNAVSEYNSLVPEKDKINLTVKDEETFASIDAFGVPMKALPQFLSQGAKERDEILSDLTNPMSGIPMAAYLTDKNGQKISEFQIWMKAVRDAGNPDLTERMRKTGEGIAVKADHHTKFNKVNEVLEQLRTIKLNKFTVMTTNHKPDA